MDTIKSIRAKLRSYKVDNERLVVDQEKKEKASAIQL